MLFAIHNNRYNSNGTVNWGSKVAIGSGWNTVADAAVYFADLDADGRADLISKESGVLFAFHNNGYNNNGTVNWGSKVAIGSGWNADADAAVYFADLDGDARTEIISKENGVLFAFHNNGYNNSGTVNWGSKVAIGSGWNAVPDTAVKFADLDAKVSGPTRCGYLLPNQGLNPGQTLRSCNGIYRLVMQTDGNLVAYINSKVVWASGTGGRTPVHVIMQSDGNLVIYFTSGDPWATATERNPSAYFRMQDDGNLVVYSSSNSVLWTSDTWCEPGCTGACRDWSCTYVSDFGVSSECGNPSGFFYIEITSQGHTDPDSCKEARLDFFSREVTCPIPSTSRSELRCGQP